VALVLSKEKRALKFQINAMAEISTNGFPVLCINVKSMAMRNLLAHNHQSSSPESAQKDFTFTKKS